MGRLYKSRIRKRDLFAFVLAALLVLLVSVVAFPQSHTFVRAFWFLITEWFRRHL